MEITLREILVSLTIIGLMVGLGIWVSSPIISAATEEYLETVSSVVVDTDDEFDYIRRTDVGRFIADGTLEAADPVSIPDIPGTYSYIKKVKEEYREHVETYTTTDSDGNVHTHTRITHSWDAVKHWTYKAEKAKFLGQTFNYSDVSKYYPKKDTVIKADTKWYENDTRYVYYTAPASIDGIMTGTADEKEYKDAKFRKDLTSQEFLERADTGIRGTRIIFWLLWLILTGGIVFGFYAAENDWLN